MLISLDVLICFLQALLAIPYPFASGTNTASALSFISTNNMFGTSFGGRDDAQNILIVITDGQSSNPNQSMNNSETLIVDYV
jgi:von Willebrand factor type A domain